MTHPSPTGIDHQELQAAVERLTDGTGDADCQEQVYYRSPLDVAREEWHKKAYQQHHDGLRPEVKVNRPTAQVMTTPAPVPLADVVDMDSFKEAKASDPA